MREYKTAKCSYCEEEKKIAARGWCRACYSRFQKTGSVKYKRSAEKKVCTVEECDKYSVSHGYCDMHRKRLVMHGHLDSTRPNDWGNRENHPLYSVWITLRRFRGGAKSCSKWTAGFWDFVADVKGRPSKHHYLRAIDENAVLCKDNFHWVERAASKDEDQKAYLKGWARRDRLENPRKYKDKHLIKSFGITLNEFERMHDEQGGVCNICRKPESALNPRTKEPRMLAVDHCHETKKIRGLLCSACNTAIGLMKDDTKILQNAIDYLNDKMM